MPSAKRIGPYHIKFYSYICGEPRHIHVDREKKSGKFWLDPVVSLQENYGYSRKELLDVERMLRAHLREMRKEWDDFCNPGTGYLQNSECQCHR